MIVLHASVSSGNGRLRLWGEAAPDETAEGPGARGTRAGRLPFDAGPDRLAVALDLTPGGFLPHPSRVGEGRIWLPTRGRRPVPSTPLVAPDPGGRGQLRLRPWRVALLTLDPEEALTFLAFLEPPVGGRRTVAPGVVVAPDLEYWRRCLRFVLKQVSEERFLPVLEGMGPGRGEGPGDGVDGGTAELRGVWRPALLGEAASRFASLVREMPPSARAVESSGAGATAGRGVGPRPSNRKGDATEPPAVTPTEVGRAFLDLMTDHLVRSAAWGGFGPPNPPAGASPSPDEAWLRVLRAQDPVLRGGGKGMENLRRRVSGWRRPVAVAADAPFRLCFRLEEPAVSPAAPEGAAAGPEADDRWRLELLLQSTADPSLRLPVRDVREDNRAVRAAFGPWRANAERFLSALGQAVGVSGVIEAALDGPDADAVELDLDAAYRFLAEDAGALEQAGFPVLLPAWWVRGATRADLGLRPTVESSPAPGRGLFSLEALVEVRWEAVLGGEPLSRDELERLAELKVPLVRMRGEWIQVDSATIRRVLERVARPSEERVRDLLRMALESEGAGGDTEDGGAEPGVRATGWVGDLLQTLRGAREVESSAASGEERDVPPPEAFRGTLRPYQLRGYAWLASLRRWGLGGCLADDMGLGKTIQALALVQRDREVREDPGPVLLVCPTSVITNWQREAERFTPDLPVLVHHGPDRPSGEALAEEVGRHGLVVTSYGLLHRDAADLRGVRWEGVVLDEAQNVKNPDTKQARAARSLEAGYRVALTGTPVENHVGDLWALMEFLNPGLLGSRRGFRERFLRPIQARRDPVATERLRRVTGPFVLRRAKSDPTILPELPGKIERRQYCSLTTEQATLYRAVLADAEESLAGAEGGDMERRGLILALLTRLKQVCNHPAHFLGDGSSVAGRSGKLERLLELAQEVLETDERALIFTQYVEMGEILKAHLEETFGRETPFLHGAVPRHRRDEMVERFQAGTPGGPAFFLLSLRAGGTGLNLTGASHVFHYDRWWNPAVEDQATDRAYRIGQSRTVQVHKLVCTGTLEERIDDMIEGKKEVARAVVGGGEAWITEMDDDGLRELLALSRDAVDDGEAG